MSGGKSAPVYQTINRDWFENKIKTVDDKFLGGLAGAVINQQMTTEGLPKWAMDIYQKEGLGNISALAQQTMEQAKENVYMPTSTYNKMASNVYGSSAKNIANLMDTMAMQSLGYKTQQQQAGIQNRLQQLGLLSQNELGWQQLYNQYVNAMNQLAFGEWSKKYDATIGGLEIMQLLGGLAASVPSWFKMFSGGEGG